ncbi:hypothetical protein HYDPIDRAFT_70921, partial [Hydnomerulius pinastri MD-312]
KKKQAEDILTMFSECCTVKFCHSDGKVETLKGHWCNECRKDEEFLLKNSKQKVFHIGSNLSCHQHIRSHYETYKVRCTERKIQVHHHAVPHNVVRTKEAVKKKARQG